MRSYMKDVAALALLIAAALPLAAQYPQSSQGIVDPPARVGRVSFLTGSVSLYPNGASDWTSAALNYPLTSNDALWSDTDARAEIHLGSSAIRMSAEASIVLGEISDTVTQLRLDQGSVDIHVRYLGGDEVYEVDTPAGVISFEDQGHYRIDVTPDGRRTTVTVRDGNATITIGSRDFAVRANVSATLIGSNRAPVMGAAIPVDAWENWADDRDHREDASRATQYVSRDMVGYEDLDQYGTWQVDQDLGPTWYPRNVPADWAPYHFGHWESVDPWGWTWIDDAPWGFAPFHYGRWNYSRGRWGWIPGESRARPVYAPALVAFFGGNNRGGSVSTGGAVGWVPLGPGEPYIPGYRASPTYIRRINVTNVNNRFDFNRIDINRIRYVNRDVPGGVTAVPRDAFERSRPIARAAIPMRPSDLATVRPNPQPVIGGQPIPAPRNDDRNRGRNNDPRDGRDNRDNRGGRDQQQIPRPPATSSATPTPPAPPPVWRGRTRPGDPSRPQQQQPQQPPPQQQGTGTQTGARPNPPTLPPQQQQNPPQDQGRNNGRPPVPPPPTPVNPPVTANPPVNPPQGGRPPAGDPQNRGRQGGGDPRQQTPPQTTPPVQPPAAPPAQQTPPPPPPPQGGFPRGRPPASGNDAQRAELAWQAQHTQLIARQAKETADLDRRQQAQLQAVPAGTSTEQLRKGQQAEKQILMQRQQVERDVLDKQHHPGT